MNFCEPSFVWFEVCVTKFSWSSAKISVKIEVVEPRTEGGFGSVVGTLTPFSNLEIEGETDRIRLKLLLSSVFRTLLADFLEKFPVSTD